MFFVYIFGGEVFMNTILLVTQQAHIGSLLSKKLDLS